MYKYVLNIILTIVAFTLSGCYKGAQNTDPQMILFNDQCQSVMKIMSFNIRVDTLLDAQNRWNNRNHIVINTIKSNKADVFGLQEAKKAQVKYIQKRLPQYTSYTVGRNDGKGKGESCAIFYRKSRFVKINSGTFWFSDTPDKPGTKDWGNLFPRICSWIHLVDNQRDSGFYVYNVHLDNWSQSSRQKSLVLLSDTIAGRKSDDPVIVMGDFNMKVDNPAMKYFKGTDYGVRSVGTYDVWSRVNPNHRNIGTRHGFSGKKNGPKIDHILVAKKIIPLKAEIDRYNENGRYPSDHFPVIATLELGRPVVANQNAQLENLGINRSNY